MKTKILLLIGVLSFSLGLSCGMISNKKAEFLNENPQKYDLLVPPQSSLISTLGYDEYTHISAEAEGRDVFKWSFSGSDSSVDITVMAMDDQEFWNFKNGDSYNYYTLSNGSDSEDSGSFTLPYYHHWYIVYINWDVDETSTDLTYDATITQNNFGGDWIIYQNWSWASYPGGLQESGIVVWEFEGSNTNVGITVMAMDEYNFLEYTRGHSYTSYILSSGDNYYDSGIFEIPYSDIWWFIFLNNDSDEETTNIFSSTFYLGPLQEDGFEENDNSTEARPIAEGNYPDLACFDDDWYSIEVTARDRLTVDISFLHLAGDLNLELYDESGALQASSESLTNNEQVSKEIDYTGVVYIRIYMSNDFDPNSYDLSVDLSLDDDEFEENDESTEAAVITEGFYPHLWCGDDDWFQIDVNAGDRLVVNLTFLHSEGDLNLGLSDETGNLQANFQSTTDNEQASVDIDFTGVVYIKVYMFDNPNFYDLTIDLISGSTSDTTDTDPSSNPDWIPGFSGFSLGIFAILGIAALMFRKRR